MVSFIDNKLIFMRKWEANLTFERATLTTYPVWIKLNNLNLALWNMRYITKLASLVGKLLDINENTRLVKRINYAKVLVELKAPFKLPRSLKAIDKNINP